MNDSTTGRYSARAFLAAVGRRIQQQQLFAPIAQNVAIAQKSVKHTPTQKLYDAFISLLMRAQGLVEIRGDPQESKTRHRRLLDLRNLEGIRSGRHGRITSTESSSPNARVAESCPREGEGGSGQHGPGPGNLLDYIRGCRPPTSPRGDVIVTIDHQ